MRNLFSLALALAAFVLSSIANAELLPLEKDTGVLRVSSEYEPNKPEVGTGILLQHPDNRLFLLTCAHLTGGKNGKIAGIPIEQLSLGERTDNFRDVKIIELDPKKISARPFAHYQPIKISEEQKKELRSKVEWTHPDEMDPEIALAEASTHELLADEKSLQNWKKSQASLVVEGTGFGTALLPPWANKSIAEGTWRYRAADTHGQYSEATNFYLSYSPVSKMITAPTARIAPGMSCSPLLYPRSDEMGYDFPFFIGGDRSGKNDFPLSGFKKPRMVVAGLGVEFKNHMAESTFNSDALILDNLHAYLKGDHSVDIPAEWNSKNGLLYLKFGNNGSEIIPEKSAGNPIALPSGNSLTVPPGNSLTVPPGTTSQKTEKCDDRELDAQTPWEKSGTKPGIIWNGQEVLGFSMQSGANSTPLLIYPDRAGIEFRNNTDALAHEMKDIPAGADMLEWLDRRIRYKNIPYKAHFYLSRQGSGAVLERFPDHLRITVDTDPKHSKHNREPKDKVEFVLNRHGALSSLQGERSKEFNPLVEVKSKNGIVYRVNLMELFFVKASMIFPKDLFSTASGKISEQRVLDGCFTKNSPYGLENAKKCYRKYMAEAFNPESVTLSIRRKCSNREYRLGFEHWMDELSAARSCDYENQLVPVPFEQTEFFKEVSERLKRINAK